jgi:hypothetical protein
MVVRVPLFVIEKDDLERDWPGAAVATQVMSCAVTAGGFSGVRLASPVFL